MKHTPGPWRVFIACEMKCNGHKFRPSHDILTEYARPKGSVHNITVADVRTPFLNDPALNPLTLEESEANAYLISAAPELLEACKAARELITSSNKIDFDDEYVPILDAAIAKATATTEGASK